MYSELIYLRCGEGIDITKDRMPVKNSGFKVYSCSEQVTANRSEDLQFLVSTAQTKAPYALPNYMDEAYIYTVPDLGSRYLLNFYPIPVDKTSDAEYSHRAGNFINQIFIGSFDEFYPYETFGNESVWDAKKRGEAYYYENPPRPLPQRDDLGDTIGYISFDDIAAFVRDGRRGALMGAVAFVVSQYSLPEEQRKYLVIRDEDSRHIELWIAAIESAFSPRMASGISFATRLDKFMNTNRYTVNLNGQYQTQINLQSPNQKLRLRAMLVGLDERDKANTSSFRVLPNSPFVVLDGKTKTLSVSIDTSDPFYKCATAFDEKHSFMCREFLQMIDIAAPSGDVLKLFAAYEGFTRYSSTKKLSDLLPALKILSQYRLRKSSTLEQMYRSIKQSVPQFLEEETVSAFSVMSWLEKTAPAVGDDTVKSSFKDMVCRAYADAIIQAPQSKAAADIHNTIKTSSFAQAAAEHLTSKAVIASGKEAMDRYSPEGWISFSEIFTEDLKRAGGGLSETFGPVLIKNIRALYLAKKGQESIDTAKRFYAIDPKQTVSVLLSEAEASKDQAYITYLVVVLTKTAPELTSQTTDLSELYSQFKSRGLEQNFMTVLKHKAKSLARTQDLNVFLEWILSSDELKKYNLSPILSVLDEKLSLADPAAPRLAATIQGCIPKNTACINSAHLCALSALDDRRPSKDIIAIVKSMAAQGFPSIEDNDYADRLVKKLFETRLPKEAFDTVVSAASGSSFYSKKIAAEAAKYIGTKHDDAVFDLIEAAAKTDSRKLSGAIADAFAGIKQFEKGMASISDGLSSKAAKQYFASVEKEAKILNEQNKKPLFLGGLFRKKEDSDSGRRGR